MIPSIGTLLRRRALLDRDAPAVVAAEGRVSFGELDARIDRLAAGLAEAGIGRGDRVACLLRNGLTMVEFYYALARLGAILCPLNFRLSAAELAYILGDSGARLLVAGDDFADVAAAAAHEAGVTRIWSAGEATIGEARLADLLARAPASRNVEEAPDPVGEDPLLLVYTSGTTGRPKGAVLTHAAMFWVSATMAFSLDYRHRDVNLIPVPLFHVGGLSFATFFVHMGATAVIPPAWEPGAILETIEREGVNHFFAVAAMLRSLLDHPRLAETDLSSVRWILAGGAPVPPALIRAFDDLGLPVQQTYGATETAGPATFVDLGHTVAKAGSAGLPFFHTDLRICDADGAVVPAETVGEVQVRAAHLVAGYWNDPEATREAFVDGWFRTGDVGRLDTDGYLYIVDRKKDVIISGGENIYPAEVETVLEAHPGIAEVAVVAVPDERWGEVPCAVVVPHAGAAAPDLDALAAFCANRLARYKHPRRLVVSNDPLPRNATGKLLKHLIRDRLRREGAEEAV